MRPQAGIIGFGRFGQLAARNLARHLDVVIADRKRPLSVPSGVRSVSIREAAAQPVLILAVPINALPSLLDRIAPFVRKDAIVFDVCSVKEEPIRWMTRSLPRSVTIIGTHPLFGPDSASESIAGRNIVLCPARGPRNVSSRLQAILEAQGLNVFTMTASEHDRIMASTLFLTQFVGHSVGGKMLPATGVTTKSFEKLRDIVATSENDSTELFRDMYRYNRYARQIPEKLLKNMQKAAARLSRRS